MSGNRKAEGRSKPADNHIPATFEQAVDVLLNTPPRKKPPKDRPPSRKKREPKTK
jgi:hypothetical protein